MQIGKIVGTVVSTQKDEKLEGFRFHVVEELTVDQKETGNVIVAIDTVGAGQGEVILYSTGSSARQTEMTEGKPVDAIIMAIIDAIVVGDKQLFNKND